MMGMYITIGILIIVILFLAFAWLYPKLKQYKVTLFLVRKIALKKHRRAVKKKKKSVWIKVI